MSIPEVTVLFQLPLEPCAHMCWPTMTSPRAVFRNFCNMNKTLMGFFMFCFFFTGACEPQASSGARAAADSQVKQAADKAGEGHKKIMHSVRLVMSLYNYH